MNGELIIFIVIFSNLVKMCINCNAQQIFGWSDELKKHLVLSFNERRAVLSKD